MLLANIILYRRTNSCINQINRTFIRRNNIIDSSDSTRIVTATTKDEAKMMTTTQSRRFTKKKVTRKKLKLNTKKKKQTPSTNILRISEVNLSIGPATNDDSGRYKSTDNAPWPPLTAMVDMPPSLSLWARKQFLLARVRRIRFCRVLVEKPTIDVIVWKSIVLFINLLLLFLFYFIFFT